MSKELKAAQFKFAYTGTNCSGKTTMALAVAARLKHNHVLAEVVSSQDRKITWNDYFFPREAAAHYGMITNLIHAEVQATLKGDATVIITDRSVLDLYAIACYDHPQSAMIKALEPTILAWMITYTKVYYLNPLPYQADGKRPDDTFRMATHTKLRELMATYNLPNVHVLDRQDLYKDLTATMGIQVPNPIFAEAEKWKTIASAMGYTLVVKHPTCAVTSDLDVWVLVPAAELINLGPDRIYARLRMLSSAYFGSDVAIHFLITPPTSVFPTTMEHTLYEPAL